MTSKRPRTHDDEPPDHVGPKKGRKKKHTNESERILTNDWSALAEGVKASSDPLYRHVTAAELDTVVGWATNITTPSANDASAIPNPLLDLPSSPLPASLLHIILEEATKAISDSVGGRLNPLIGAFDQSALVSMGICLEEVITASLLPLAEAYVQICKSEDGQDNEWDNWSLPPEESIVAISQRCWQDKQQTATLLSLLPPKLTAVPGERPSSMFNLPLEGEAGLATKIWAKAHGQSLEFVDENKDIFNVFHNARME